MLIYSREKDRERSLCSSLEVVRWRPAMQLPNRCSKRRGHEWREPMSVDASFGILRHASLVKSETYLLG